jgi:hypothetical protein
LEIWNSRIEGEKTGTEQNKDYLMGIGGKNGIKSGIEWNKAHSFWNRREPNSSGIPALIP